MYVQHEMRLQRPQCCTVAPPKGTQHASFGQKWTLSPLFPVFLSVARPLLQGPPCNTLPGPFPRRNDMYQKHEPKAGLTRILCIDPGSRITGWVILDRRQGALPEIVDHGNTPTAEFLEWLRAHHELSLHQVVIEHVGHYGTGMSAGADVFETCILIGRIVEILRPLPVEKVRRQSIKTQLCGRATAKDSNVRQALIDRWGGDELALGARKCSNCKGKGWRGRGRSSCDACGDGWEIPPGPLHGVTTHAWSALAAGLYYLEVQR